MSWFEKAKSAIIEALDIQDEDGDVDEAKTPTNKGSTENVIGKSDNATTSTESLQQNPVATAAQMLSSWGSFKGSFFENPKSNEMITSAPKAAGSAMKQPMQSLNDDNESETVSVGGADGLSLEGNHEKEDNLSIHSSNEMLVEQVITVAPKAATPKDFQDFDVDKKVSESKVITSPPKGPGIVGSAKRQFVNITEETMWQEKDKISEIKEKESRAGNAQRQIPSETDSTACTIENIEKTVSLPLVPGDSKIGLAQRQTQDNEFNFIIKPIENAETEEKLLLEQEADMNKTLIGTEDGSSSMQSSIVMLLESDKNSPNMQNSGDSDSTQSFEDIQMQASCQTNRSDEKSDFEKLDSKSHSSPPHSNDEIETTTSSDIEIISHPNGDSSSTNSTNRTSPLKTKKSITSLNTSPDEHPSTSNKLYEVQKRGHYREASEVSILSEDSQTEVEKLAQRINELNEILEAREIRLLQSERSNAALRENNEELQKTIENLKSNSSYHDSTKQLSILEKKFQTSLQESNALRIQISSLKNEIKEMIPKNELLESKQLVDELRLEGEKLAKEVLLHSNIIKKLRAKEKTTDATLKKNGEQLSQLNEEVERLKKTLIAKEDIERTQIESIHRLSSEKQKLFDENNQQNSKIEDLQSKLSTLQASFEAAKTELQQRSRLFNDISKTAESAEAAKEAKQKAELEKDELVQQVNELKEKIRYTEENMGIREQKLRADNKELQQLFEAAELRAEASTQDVSLVTIPLLRQIESLQKTLNQRTTAWSKEEKDLLEKIRKAESRLSSVEKTESLLQEQTVTLKSRCKDLEEKLSQSLIETENAKIALRQVESNYELNEAKLNREIVHLTTELEEFKTKLKLMECNVKELENSLQIKDRPPLDLSNRLLTESALSEAAKLSEAHHSDLQDPRHMRSSPPNSYGANSLEEAIGGSIDWQHDDLDCVSNPGQHSSTNFGQGVNLNFMPMTSSSTIEHLQSLLKQRDGEICHLQSELNRLQEERIALSDEISRLSIELETFREKIANYELMESNHNDLQTRYEALLEMFGEKVERMQELELDLIEARQAYKLQIDELLSQKPEKT